MLPPYDELDDRALLGAFTHGDHDAFGVLFRRHRDRLWAVAVRTCGNPEDAADALQEAMVHAYRRADSFRGDAQVTTWLHRIVVNACLDKIRRNKVRAADPLPEDLHLRAGSTDVAADALATERRSLLLAALARLPQEQRVALVLVDMEGYPVEEVARILDCPTGTVKSRCARGRARLAGDAGLAALQGTRPPPGPSDEQDPHDPLTRGGAPA